MDTVAESVCCREIPAVTRTMEEDGVHSCIIDHPGFRSGCLDIWVLRIAYYGYRQHYAISSKRAMIKPYKHYLQ
ncbi:hypothetical protein CesoFtcFv8_016402 [Champsocephalus esox]|uniref:Uncharacterized protein n=1 Tax=Champsocephalus esox TaxID=159716 RepID=A0AAN8GQF9_9TELE|nr:hypothetical protein CesoFtcFv8_016402 [Champsocephalus esox]